MFLKLGNTDKTVTRFDEFSFNAFNLDVFFTWDFRLGSRLIVGWKNALGPDASVDGAQYNKYLGNLQRVFSIPHSNELSVKFVYYVDYNDLRRHKNS